MGVSQQSTTPSNLTCNNGILSDAPTTTSVGQSTAWVPTSPITLNNRLPRERYTVGVSRLPFPRHLLPSYTHQLPFSCDADSVDLDNSTAQLRTQEQFFALLETEGDNELWFGYGIVPNFLVSNALSPIPEY